MKSMSIIRPSKRCKHCKAWVSGKPHRFEENAEGVMAMGRPVGGETADELCGGCGGDLEFVDMQAHLASVPYVPYDATRDKK
jgi:hypothetical protein